MEIFRLFSLLGADGGIAHSMNGATPELMCYKWPQHHGELAGDVKLYENMF